MANAAAAPGKLPSRTALAPVADEAFDRFAEIVRTVLGVPVALVSLVDQERQVFPGACGLPEPWATSRTTPLSHSFCQHVVLTAAPIVVADARLDERLSTNLAIADIGVIAYAGMPLVDRRGAVTGSLCAIDGEPRQWSASELALLSDLAAACSAELQLRDAVAAAAAAQERTQLLMDLAQALSATTTIADVSRVIANLARGSLGAEFGGIVLLDTYRRNLAYTEHSASALQTPSALKSFPIDGPRPSAVAVRTNRPLYFDTVAELVLAAPEDAQTARDTGGESFAYLPLRTAGHVRGCLSMFWREQHTLSATDREVLESLAGYCAQAVYRAELLAERRDVARVMQTALMPKLPAVPGVALAGRYRPANAADQVGGDWFDAFSLDGSRVYFSVGDVLGHDTAAAAAMGQLRASLRTLLIDRPEQPNAILERLDRLMRPAGHDRLTTALLATLEPLPAGGHRLRWANAGHPPPLLLEPGCAARYLSVDVDPLLGLALPRSRRTHEAELRAGSTVLLFTDGLVERREEDINDGLERLRHSAERHRERPLEDLLELVLADVLAPDHDDDTVLFAIRGSTS